MIDTFSKILAPTLDLSFLMVTFFGEALFMVWLLWRSARGRWERSTTDVVTDQRMKRMGA